MPRFKMIVFLNPVEGREDEFNPWYNHQHVPDVLSIDRFRTGQRFQTGPTYMERDAPCAYAAIYDMEADSLEEAVAAASHGAATSRFRTQSISPAPTPIR